ncbi:hypothetical protein DEU56DRAFT_783453, partial [Suillus clintonianus]|uniref:uncharacterized protein n=1 Tax=Suillus clintonianus TaxID=1904413 RepID=UPI001B864F37
MSNSSRVTSSTTKSPYTSAPLNALDALAAHASSSREANALPSSGTRGFTSLVLPRAATSPATSGSNSGVGTWRPWKAGRRATAAESLGAGLGFGDEVDLTRAGLAQTTMASVEIVRGIASGTVQRQGSKSRGPLFGLGWFSKNNAKQEGKISAGSCRESARFHSLSKTSCLCWRKFGVSASMGRGAGRRGCSSCGIGTIRVVRFGKLDGLYSAFQFTMPPEPILKAIYHAGRRRTFENTPQVFIREGGLDHGGTVVSRI